MQGAVTRTTAHFSQAVALRSCRATFRLTRVWPSGVYKHSILDAAWYFQEAQCAFKILMIHELLQFA